MFLSNQDFYYLRRITLSDLLDNQSAYKLTSKVVVQAKKAFYKKINPEVEVTRKRKRADFDELPASEKILEEFEHEKELAAYYKVNEDGQKMIQFEESFYITMEVKEILNKLDLKEEVVLTMLNQLEKAGPYFRVDSILPRDVGIRFHKKTLE